MKQNNENAKSEVYPLKNELIPASECIGAKSLKNWGIGKELESQVNEGFVIKNKMELRKQQTNLPKDRLEGVQGQLQIQFENDPGTYVGSGTLCIFGDGFENNKYFLLTCAHNVISMQQGVETKINRPARISYYYSRENANKYYCSLIGERYNIHRGYEQKKDIWNGFDLALVKLKNDNIMNSKYAPLSQNSQWGAYLENSGAKVGSTIKVIVILPNMKEIYTKWKVLLKRQENLMMVMQQQFIMILMPLEVKVVHLYIQDRLQYVDDNWCSCWL